MGYRPSTSVYVIVGSRHRHGWGVDCNEDSLVLDVALRAALRDRATVVGMGCDAGFGKLVRDEAVKRGIPFVEVAVLFHGTKPDVQQYFAARHAALMELGTHFYIYLSSTRTSLIEDLIERIERSSVPYVVFREDGVRLVSRGVPE